MQITIQDIFNAMPGRFNKEAAGAWEADVQFRFANGDGVEEPWFMSVKGGECRTGQGELENPTTTIKTPAEVWVGMILKTVDPMQAFMSGQLRIEGNVAAILKLQDKNLFRWEE